MSETPPRLSREKSTAKRRRHILEAAVICFLEEGYHQTGVRDIARRAGVSLGNLYNHFPGKHDVLVEIATLERDELAPFLKTLASAAPAPKVLDRFVTAYAKYLAQPENVILSIEITNEALRQPDIADLFVANRQGLIDALAAVLSRGMQAGELRPLPSAEEGAQLLLSLIEGSAYRSVLSEVPMRRLLGPLKDFALAAVLP